MPRASGLAKTSRQDASEGVYSGSQCQASSMLQSAKEQGNPALSVMQPNLEGARKPPARQRQHQHRGLHLDQHVGVPQQAILACLVIVQEQKWSETEVRRVTPCAVREPCESSSGSGNRSGRAREPGRCTSSGEIAIHKHSSQGRATSVPYEGAMHEALLWWRKAAPH